MQSAVIQTSLQGTTLKGAHITFYNAPNYYHSGESGDSHKIPTHNEVLDVVSSLRQDGFNVKIVEFDVAIGRLIQFIFTQGDEDVQG